MCRLRAANILWRKCFRRGSLLANELPKENCQKVTGKETQTMKEQIMSFMQDEQGQDLIEYTLLMAFVCLTSAALFVGAGSSVSGVWTTTNTQLAAANTAANN